MAQERLHKIIAQSGLCSRRAAEALIAEGAVRVNGHKITEAGTKADPLVDTIIVNNKPLPKPQQTVAYILNKPAGVICSAARQAAGSKLAIDFVPSNPPVYTVGRLDKESEGMLILTNDGVLTHELTHPKFEKEKRYVVEVIWDNPKKDPLTQERLSELLAKGVKLSDGKVTGRLERFKRSSNGTTELIIAVFEGRHHLVRRMCAVLGYKTKKLRRVQIGSLMLTKLPPGGYRMLTKADIALLTRNPS
jgi:23S rRNA pseudouridine2605 synthase